MPYWARGLAVLLLLAHHGTHAQGLARLIWHDEFDELNLQVWNHLVTGWRGGNDEFQYYRNSRKNSYVRDGILYLRPTLTAEEHGTAFLYNGSITDPACNQKPCSSVAGKDIVLPIQSARIRTQGSFSFRYGRLQVRAQLPRGDWIWPAIWLKPADNLYGAWPASGEVDLVEARGNRKLTDAKGRSQGIDVVGSTLHFGVNSSFNVWRPTHWTMALENPHDFAENFHLYEMEWSESCIRFRIDGVTVGTQGVPDGGFWKLGGFDKNPGGTNIWENGEPMAPFDKEFFIILNVAVGGRFFPDGMYNSPYPKPWNWSSPHPMRDFWEQNKLWYPTWYKETAAMKIDYVRVYSVTPSSLSCV